MMTNNGTVTRSSRPNIKAGWQYKSLISVSKVLTDGDWIESKDQASDGIRLIQTGNVGVGQFKDRAEKARYISEETFSRLRCEEVFQSDCLISRLPDPVGRACIIPEIGERMITAVDCSIVRLDHQIVLPEFFNYYAQSTEYLSTVASKCTGTTRNRISRANLGEIELAVPPIKEQERILAVLDECLEAIASARANVEMTLLRTKSLLDSEIQLQTTPQREGWNSLTLAEVASDYGRGKSKHRPRNDPKLYGGAYPFVQTGDVRNAKRFITTYSQTYNEDGLSQSKLWPKGTLCVTIAANIAETAILDFDACFPDSVIGVVANPSKANTRFIEYQLRVAKAQLQAKGKGSAQDNINLATFETHPLSFPSLSVQEALVERLDSVALLSASLTDALEQKLALLDELKQSLLNQAFSGNL